MHGLPPHAESSSSVHCTQVPAPGSQTPSPSMPSHCPESLQPTHIPDTQRAAVGSEQSPSPMQPTQTLSATSQMGVSPVHAESSSASHCTQTPFSSSQTGRIPVQAVGQGPAASGSASRGPASVPSRGTHSSSPSGMAKPSGHDTVSGQPVRARARRHTKLRFRPVTRER